MAKRWLQAKLLKIKRQRRSYLKSYTLPRPKAGSKATEHSPESIRTAGFRLPDSYSWGQEIPPTRIDLDHFLNTPRAAALLRSETLESIETLRQNDRLQGIQKWVPSTVEDTKRHRLIVLVCRESHIFLLYSKITETVKRSALYDTQGEAQWAYQNGKIYWRKEIHNLGK